LGKRRVASLLPAGNGLDHEVRPVADQRADKMLTGCVNDYSIAQMLQTILACCDEWKSELWTI
jgi:hypothetical protein